MISDKHLLPVTVIVKRIAKKNKIKEFEDWLSGISKEVSSQVGNMGIDIKNLDLNTLSYSDLITMTILRNGRIHQ
ncbi:MAG: hypothetical protein WA941_00670 [Nitrososphaeraceae archaeon]